MDERMNEGDGGIGDGVFVGKGGGMMKEHGFKRHREREHGGECWTWGKKRWIETCHFRGRGTKLVRIVS